MTVTVWDGGGLSKEAEERSWIQDILGAEPTGVTAEFTQPKEKGLTERGLLCFDHELRQRRLEAGLAGNIKLLFLSGPVTFEMLLDIDMPMYEFGAQQEAGA